jgi:hypothetical protein
MGFLNALTGGAAQVQMNLQKQRYQAGESVFAWVNITAMDNINAEGVVLHLFCVEHTQGGHCQRCNMNIPDQNDTVYNNEIMISGPKGSPQHTWAGMQRTFGTSRPGSRCSEMTRTLRWRSRCSHKSLISFLSFILLLYIV